ncbi:unnamed protein product, partial [Prorocentrum cordatum]
RFMRAQAEQCDVLGFAETHLRGEKLEKMKVDMSKDGWKAIATPSTLTGLEEGRAQRSAKDPFEGFCPPTWHTKSGDLIVVAAYLQPKFGFRGPNERMLIRMTAFSRLLADPWVVLGDWNNQPSEWDKTKWLRKLDGSLVLPTNVATTCNLGQGTPIDYGIARSDLAASLKLDAVVEVPWETHVGLALSICDGKCNWWNRVIQAPREPATTARPKKQADPNSLRQRALTSRRKRKEALDQQLQEACDEIHRIEEDAA